MDSIKTKKILIVFLGRTNSGPVFSYNLADGIAKTGHEVYTLLSSSVQNKEQWDNNNNINKIYIPTYNGKFSFLINTITFLLIRIWIYKIRFRKYKFDVVIRTFHHPWSEFVNTCFKYSKIYTICHDPIPHSSDPFIKKYLYKKHVLNSDEVIVLTKKFINVIHDNYGFEYANICYMPHGLMNFKKGNITKKISFNVKHFNFIFFGRIQEYKGIDELIDAYCILREEYSQSSLYIVGNGVLPENSKKLENDPNVHIYNEYIKEEDIESFFSIPNLVCVLPYKNATQSGVIPIAIEFGVPVIASDTGGLKEQLDNGNIGIIYKNNNIENLEKSMKMFFENKCLYNSEKEKINKFASSLDWSSIAKKIVD